MRPEDGKACTEFTDKYLLANSVTWAPFDAAGKAEQENLLTIAYVKALSDLAPYMGAYVNEVSSIVLNRVIIASTAFRHAFIEIRQVSTADGTFDRLTPTNQIGKKYFWGTNYPRLLDIKRKVDPHDVFWCTACVGNERWAEVGDKFYQA